MGYSETDDERDLSRQTADAAGSLTGKTADYLRSSNPLSKRRQKQDIKRSYREKGSGTGTLYENLREYSGTPKEKISRRLREYPKDRKVYFFVIGACFAVMLAATLLSVTTTLFQGISGSSAMTTYLSEDRDMLNALDYYRDLQWELRKTIDNYERTHSYDEYHYTLGEITDNPCGIISLLSAYSPVFTYPEISDFERKIFSAQYTLTEKIKKEARYRTAVDYVLVTEPNNQGVMLTYWKRVETYEPYEYRICYLTLSCLSAEAAAKKLLTKDQYDMYRIYTETKGNRQDLFEDI